MTSNIVEALKPLPKYSCGGSLGLPNPFHWPSAPAPADEDAMVAEVEHVIDCVLEPAGLSLERARLLFMEEAATLQDLDLLLVVVYTALGRYGYSSWPTVVGRIWPWSKTLRQVHDAFRAFVRTRSTVGCRSARPPSCELRSSSTVRVEVCVLLTVRHSSAGLARGQVRR